MQNYRFSTLLLFVLLSACGSDDNKLSEYNDNLYLYEKKLNECAELEGRSIEGVKVLGVTDEVIRIGLTYFYIKNSLDCTTKEADALVASVDELTENLMVSEYIRFNARDLKETISFNLDQLIEPSKQFDLLSVYDRKVLESMSVSNRPFNPSAALKYYIDD